MRPTRSLLAVTTAVVVVAVVVGCSSASGQPTPATSHPTGSDPAASSTSSQPGSGLTPHGAPTVAHPVDVTAFEQNPCSMLTATQIQQTGISVQGTVTTSSLLWGCAWHDTFGATGADIEVGLLKGGGGLDAVYSSRSTLSLFQPIPAIDGYPAVLADATDDRTNGGCVIDVGVRDDVALDVDVALRGGTNPAHDYSDPCGVAHSVAQGALATMTRGS